MRILVHDCELWLPVRRRWWVRFWLVGRRLLVLKMVIERGEVRVTHIEKAFGSRRSVLYISVLYYNRLHHLII